MTAFCGGGWGLCENCGGVLKRSNSRACALETTASFLALPVPCIPGPMKVARGREALGARMAKVYRLMYAQLRLRYY